MSPPHFSFVPLPALPTAPAHAKRTPARTRCSQHSIEIIRTTAHWVAVSKPPHLLVHNTTLTPTHTPEPTLISLLPSLLPHHPPPSLIHRLDKPTSGIMLLALGPTATELHTALQTADKSYFALSKGADMPQEWVNEHPLTDMSGHKKKGGPRKKRDAKTLFSVLKRYPMADVVAVSATIRTGRRHQIRRHLSNSRYPVLGDTSHGKGVVNRWVRDQFAVSRCCLHSHRLSFIDPFTDERVTLQVPLPTDLELVCQNLDEYEISPPDVHPLSVVEQPQNPPPATG